MTKKIRFIKLVIIPFELLLFSISMPFILQFAMAEEGSYNSNIHIEEIGLTATAPKGWYVNVVSKEQFQDVQLQLLERLAESGKIDETELANHLAKQFTPRLIYITKYPPSTKDPLQPIITINVMRPPGVENREEKMKANIKKTLSTFGSEVLIIEEPMDIIINDKKYIKYIICESDARIRQTYLLNYNNLIYTIYMLCDKTKFDNYRPIFDEFIDNLTIE